MFRSAVCGAFCGPTYFNSFENGHRDFGGLVWRSRRWRNAQLLRSSRSAAPPLVPAPATFTALLPDFSRGLTGEALWTLPVITFVVHLAVQWWAFWYPGRNRAAAVTSHNAFSARR